jgi:hypothetical protein
MTTRTRGASFARSAVVAIVSPRAPDPDLMRRRPLA